MEIFGGLEDKEYSQCDVDEIVAAVLETRLLEEEEKMNKKIFAVIKSFKSWLNDNCVDDLMNEFIINLIFIFIFLDLLLFTLHTLE